jgi:hypothetical protein
MWDKLCGPYRVELWTIRGKDKEADWDWRCALQGHRLLETLKAWPIDWVYCELPCFFESAGGLMVASQNDLVKLAFLVGIYGGVCATRGVPFTPVPVAEWKGQLPKAVVNRRIVKILGEGACREFRQDIWDSVGIGLYAKGWFK